MKKKMLAACLMASLLLGFTLAQVYPAEAFYERALSGEDEEEPEAQEESEEEEAGEHEESEEEEIEEEGEEEREEEAGEQEESEEKEEETEEEDEKEEEEEDEEEEEEEEEKEDDKEEEEEDEKEDDDRDGVDDEKESQEKRKLEIEVSERSAKVESEFETEEVENELEIEFEAKEGVTIELKYKNETEAEDEEVEAELELKVFFTEVVEYVDVDGDGALTEGDEIVQVIDLEELKYTTPEVTTIQSVDGEEGYKFELTGVKDGFGFNVTAVLFSTYALVDDTLVSPTESKITLGFEGFPFINETSRLALRVSAVSEMEVERETEEEETEVKVKSKVAEGYFNWESWAWVDGAKETVTDSMTGDGDETYINLCYPRGSRIVHDPKIGVGINAPPFPAAVFVLVNTPLLIGTGIVATIVLVAAVALGKRRESFIAGGTEPPLIA